MKMTIKEKFRSLAGSMPQHKCGECNNCIRLQCGAHSHYKCKVMGITGSAATDIRLKDKACKFFEMELKE